jgi:hypothetical protein
MFSGFRRQCRFFFDLDGALFYDQPNERSLSIH